VLRLSVPLASPCVNSQLPCAGQRWNARALWTEFGSGRPGGQLTSSAPSTVAQRRATPCGSRRTATLSRPPGWTAEPSARPRSGFTSSREPARGRRARRSLGVSAPRREGPPGARPASPGSSLSRSACPPRPTDMAARHTTPRRRAGVRPSAVVGVRRPLARPVVRGDPVSKSEVACTSDVGVCGHVHRSVIFRRVRTRVHGW
jgi:hypothetical protein